VTCEQVLYACSGCGFSGRVPAAFAGQRGRCPACLEWVEVAPDAALAPASAPSRAAQAHCRSCGERIKARAIKCRYCGDFQHPSLGSRRAHGEGVYRLASPGARLAAAVFDYLLWLLPSGLLGWLCSVAASHPAGRPWDMILGGLAVLWGLGFLGAQYLLITRRGASVGKRLLGLRIVRVDGGAVDFVSGVALRNLLPAGVTAVTCVGYGLGGLFWLADKVLIFSPDRRCLHDHLAGTRVVLASSLRAPTLQPTALACPAEPPATEGR
jgi:uncharacterized RDD family membrane protein YckC